uniref:Uncharacterized protein n=1 Tax=Candidatus Kentrum sp. LPFa TaxID=2126335 RepID=A0A450VX13_9GAMM|nr:MAG: hypothetical protein BECKLPF1236A_GA0070988_1002312 [Candidatus Kentron sp. LPFa]VFK26407.1 MAG: hypothetical protein BECKLPF1236C_GA0070990_100358 [Candidatus Kentron sp. LPFa]
MHRAVQFFSPWECRAKEATWGVFSTETESVRFRRLGISGPHKKNGTTLDTLTWQSRNQNSIT